MIKKYILPLLFLFFYGCSINLEIDKANVKKIENPSKEEQEEIKLPNDIRWITNSPEYKILCEQTYKNAWDNLSVILNEENSKSAIIMDLDETVLDNSKYQIGLVEKNESYNPESWSVWINLKEAELVPGAKQFIDSVRTTNTRIIFLSNRMAKNESPTIENMQRLKIYDKTDIFLLRLDKADKKHIRRAEAINGTGRLQDIGPMKILGYFGDAYHDFPDESNIYIFGENMFMFPNPMYGKW
tara:strand:+ start:107 stop:832 length:726 start_codon:yes stop_codon:yes gene_type:complete